MRLGERARNVQTHLGKPVPAFAARLEVRLAMEVLQGRAQSQTAGQRCQDVELKALHDVIRPESVHDVDLIALVRRAGKLPAFA